METLETIHKRCSLKAHISTRQIEQEKIETILEAGSLAPSARNNQPWRFIVVQDKPKVAELIKAFSESNQVIRDAPVVLITCARAVDDVIRDGKQYYLFDVGLAVENMVLAATELGLVTHLMTAFDEAQVKQLLHIPEDVRTVVATPLAYPREGNYDEAARERLSMRTRKELKELVHYNTWREAEPA
ncbi:MAG: nitroreductase family protein [Anaerolineales bacterium]